MVAQVEAADLLIIGSSVYRASYTGVLKHLFDLVQRPALVGKIALLAATGGSAQHGLMIEHQMRPMMNFFGTYIVPTGIYATEADFDGMDVVGPTVRDRMARAAEEAAWLAPPPATGVDARPPVARCEPAPCIRTRTKGQGQRPALSYLHIDNNIIFFNPHHHRLRHIRPPPRQPPRTPSPPDTHAPGSSPDRNRIVRCGYRTPTHATGSARIRLLASSYTGQGFSIPRFPSPRPSHRLPP